MEPTRHSSGDSGWYTHTTDGAATRWYSLQGTAPAGARPATLVIYANEGGNFAAGPPTMDEATAAALREIVAKGAMPPLVLEVADCRAAYAAMRARGVEFIQEPVDRYGNVDAGFRDPSGNGWKMVEARKG